MADDTRIDLRQKIMYCLFIRNFTAEGTFRAAIPELARIKALGVYYLFVQPIYPIGKEKRKGTLGSPYAIRDYMAINPEFGGMKDFEAFVEACRELGLKIVLDIVFNHTSPDSDMAIFHPEMFYRNAKGVPRNHAGDWSDVVDLDYRERSPLWDVQIKVLLYWAKYVDGFRCDVGSLVNKDFWLEARSAVAKVKKDFVWLVESVHSSMKHHCHENEIYCASDGEMYQAFDMTYDYDIYEQFYAAVDGEISLKEYLHALYTQEITYPANYVKLRMVENHDQKRAAHLFGTGSRLRNWTAMIYFIPGTTLLFMGQERGVAHEPSLFDKDTVDWDTGVDISDFLTRLGEIVREEPFRHSAVNYGVYGDDIAVLQLDGAKERMYGIFQLGADSAGDSPAETVDPAVTVAPTVSVDLASLEKISPAVEFSVKAELADGDYVNLITDRTFRIEDRKIALDGEPIIFKVPK